MKLQHREHLARVAGLFILTNILACGSDEPSTPTPTQATTSTEASPVTEAAQTPETEESPPPAPPPPPPPDARATALAALVAGDYVTTCAYLEFERFDPSVCEYFAKRAEGERAQLSSRTLERFLRSHDVARRRGSVRGWFQEPDAYEVSVNRRTSILEVTDTRFQTTGRFTMWAQRLEDEEVELTSGRVLDVPYYIEWTLADDMLDAMRARGERAEDRAKAILLRLIRDWTGDRKQLDEDRPASEWPAFLAERRAAAEPESAEDGATPGTGGVPN